MNTTVARLAFVLSFPLASAVPVLAQCAEWKPFDPGYVIQSNGGPTGKIYAYAEFDDGSGPALYAGGDFVTIDGVSIKSIAKNVGPNQWAPLGSGTTGRIYALAVFDDGSGPALYVGGFWSSIGGLSGSKLARWDGSSWSTVGIVASDAVRSLVVIDLGSGPELYAGGEFTMIGGVPANHVAKWNGTTWSALGSGTNTFTLGVQTIAAFDDGSGMGIYVGGDFTTAGGSPAPGIAKWDGAAWGSLGTGLAINASAGTASALSVFDDGAGPALFVGGDFLTAGGVSAHDVARWDGTSWSALGASVSDEVLGLSVFDDGSGPALIACGAFTTAGSVAASGVARWDGSDWTTLGNGLPGGDVHVLLPVDDGSGPRLFAGGRFPRCIASSNGSEWQPRDEGIDSEPRALAVFDDGSGPAIYAGGAFTTAGGIATSRIAKWDGSTWSPVGGGMNGDVYSFALFDDGSGGGDALYVGGAFTSAGGVAANRIAKWNGSSWSPLAGGTTGPVWCMTVWDDGNGTALYVGGQFSFADGLDVHKVARWKGSHWSTLGAGLGGNGQEAALSLAVWDDGTGPALFVGGSFNTAGGTASPNIAKWTGSAWQVVPGGVNGSIGTLCVWDDGTGSALYAGGISTIGGFSYHGLARWNGANWSTLGAGTNGNVYFLTPFDDGSGLALYAAGDFTTAGGTSANEIAKWNGSSWSPLDGGITGTSNAWVRTLVVYDDGADGAPDLYAGGHFLSAGSSPSRSFAQWKGCEPGTAYCFGDGVDSLVTAQCPCGNFGEPGRGCANSNSALGGGKLWASGSTNPNTLVFTCDGIPNNSFATFLRSNASDDMGFVFGDGIKCLNGTGIRFGAQNAGQGGNPANTVISTAATVASGNTRYYQLHYRNPNAGFCPPETFNISNGYAVAW